MIESQKGLKEVVLAGNNREQHQTLLSSFLPFATYLKASDHSNIPLVADKSPVNGRDTIFVCHKRVCQLPVHNVDQAIAQIKA